jgi:hypothetical protein
MKRVLTKDRFYTLKIKNWVLSVYPYFFIKRIQKKYSCKIGFIDG